MIVDARKIPNDSVINCDLCIVGAGTAGLTIAREFLGRPESVVLLESGGLTPDAETQSLYSGKVTAQPYFDLDAARSREVHGPIAGLEGAAVDTLSSLKAALLTRLCVPHHPNLLRS